jgi:hypothetical protein
MTSWSFYTGFKFISVVNARRGDVSKAASVHAMEAYGAVEI